MRKLKAKSYKPKANQGFTLIELLIYLALVSAVVTSLILWVLNLSGLRDKNYVTAEVTTNRQFLSSFIAREVRQAAAVLLPTPGAAGAVLNLGRPGALADAAFYVSAGTLYFEVLGQAAVPVTSRQVEIANLEFRNLAGPFDDRANVVVFGLVRFRNPSSPEFRSEQPFLVSVSQRL